jgi:histidinol-phosphatase (PHP family)
VWEPGATRSAEQVWEAYFETIAASARCGLFDVIAHPDLVKYWAQQRRTPRGDLRRYYEPAVQAIAEAGLAVELSTAGLRKPAGELYPAPAFLEMCLAAQIPVALSSDAHRPEDIGAGYEQALELLGALGVHELCVFEGRTRSLRAISAQAASGEGAAR